MPTITRIGLDLAKKVFQIHGVDAEGKVVVARKLRRREVLAFFAKLPPCPGHIDFFGPAFVTNAMQRKLIFSPPTPIEELKKQPNRMLLIED